LASTVKIGGIVSRTPHPGRPGQPRNGGPQMVEVSRDGRRIYLTNSLYASWDEQFYPEGLEGWMVKIDADPQGGMALDPRFVLAPPLRPHQVHLEGGDASSDSYCYR
jgi:methanethiol oxidase